MLLVQIKVTVVKKRSQQLRFKFRKLGESGQAFGWGAEVHSLVRLAKIWKVQFLGAL
jgi:hypothetical protein